MNTNKPGNLIALIPVCFHGHTRILAVPGVAGAYKSTFNQLESPALADVVVKHHCSLQPRQAFPAHMEGNNIYIWDIVYMENC